MLNAIKRWALYVAAVAAAILIAFRSGMRREVLNEKLREAKDGLAAERTRDEVDAEIQEDTDLVGRARRAGVVRRD